MAKESRSVFDEIRKYNKDMSYLFSMCNDVLNDDTGLISLEDKAHAAALRWNILEETHSNWTGMIDNYFKS